MSARPAVVFGVDAGTTSVKSVALTLDGEQIGSARRAVPLLRGPLGEVEVSMDAVWDAVAATLREVSSVVGARSVVGVGITGQGDGLWMLDAEGRPARTHAPTWLDARATARANAWVADGRAEALWTVTGTTTFAGATPVLFAELAESEPESLRRASAVLHCADWLGYRLTGVLGTDVSEASRTLLDIGTLRYDEALGVHLGIPALAALLQPAANAGDLAGRVTVSAAAETGLPAGTPVATGMIDVLAAGLGLGATRDSAGWLILGTTGCVAVLLPSIADRRCRESMVLATGRGTRVLEFLAPAAGSTSIDWATGLLSGSGASLAGAAGVPAGSGGVLYLPYGAPGGERAPFRDPHASASWLGLSNDTTGDQALRAVYEGVAYSLAECVDLLGLDGDLSVAGGGFAVDLLCQVLADATGRGVRRPVAAEVGARGAAALGLVAAGAQPDVQAAAAALPGPATTFQPNPDAADAHVAGRAAFTAARAALRPVWPKLSTHTHHDKEKP